ncbi:MAG: aspartate 1-decarboxylase [Sedimentisphaerales bacterium]|nr:aspartate 1-decarboxylase [Sedimentisphaerales bacterium]
MQVTLLKSKIHRATVTDANLHYTGSITIDQDLMDAAGILPYEKVLVANLDNGTRHETYTVPGERGSGVILTMGAAARLVHPGDRVIIMAFAEFDPTEVPDHKPKVVIVDDKNRITKVL